MYCGKVQAAANVFPMTKLLCRISMDVLFHFSPETLPLSTVAAADARVLPMRKTTTHESGRVAAVAVGPSTSSPAGRRRQQQSTSTSTSRPVASTATVVAALAAVAAVGGFPRADGFFAAPTASLMAAGSGARRTLGKGSAAANTCWGRGREINVNEGVQVTVARMTSEPESVSAGECV